MADAKTARPSEDDAALLAVEATEPVVLQEPERPDMDAEHPSVAPPVPEKPAKRQSGFLGYVVAGLVLAGAGFGAATYLSPETGAAEAIAALQAQLDARSAEEAALRSEVAALAQRPVADPALADRIAALETTLASLPDTAGLGAQLDILEERLGAIETASVGGQGAPAAALAAMDREIKALKASVAAQSGTNPAAAADIEAASAAVEARLKAAEAIAVSAAKQAALSHVRAAFESGAPLGPALDGLKAMGAEIPATLAPTDTALPSLLSLQDSFAEPARAALDASIRAEMGEGWTDRALAFLRSQSGARSLTPREGTDPDAVLSRAEAALRGGNLAATLAELAGLPPAGVDAMSPWVAEATRRLDAERAITDLSAALNGQ